MSLRSLSDDSRQQDCFALSENATDRPIQNLARRVVQLYEAKQESLPNQQLFVGIAGGPGSGKTTIAEQVARRINALQAGEQEEDVAVVLPMDGFHYSRAELRAMAQQEHSTSTYEQLMERRGAPWTFDSTKCVEAFTRARQTGHASLPVYDRSKSDPVPNGVELRPSHKMVFLEGNYLLAWDDPAWAPLREIFDETWYIACTSMDEQRERLIQRHLKNWTGEKQALWGEGRFGAERKANSNDVPNSLWIEKTSRHHADLVVLNQ